jgi:predicted outer membrane protein
MADRPQKVREAIAALEMSAAAIALDKPTARVHALMQTVVRYIEALEAAQQGSDRSYHELNQVYALDMKTAYARVEAAETEVLRLHAVIDRDKGTALSERRPEDLQKNYSNQD